MSEKNRATKNSYVVCTPSGDDVHIHNTSSGVTITTLVSAKGENVLLVNESLVCYRSNINKADLK